MTRCTNLQQFLSFTPEERAQITSLDFFFSLGGEHLATELAVALCGKGNSALTSLNLGGNDIGDDGVAGLAIFLKKNGTLTELDLQCNHIGNKGAVLLAKALKTNTTLTTLNLARNAIGAEGAEALADSLKENNTLTSLALLSNNIGNKGAVLLAKALKTNTTLTTLNLARNNIGSEGAAALAEALKENSTLTSLDLGGNKIGTEGAEALTEALKGNSTLERLDLAWNNIGAEGAVALAEALKINGTLTMLNLYGGNIGVEGAKAIAEVLKTNTTLSRLHLEGKDLGAEGAKAIAEVLKTNTTLTMFGIENNNIGAELKGHIKELVERNELIQKAVLDSLKTIAAGNDVVDIDIREIENIKHIESIKNPIINPLDRYAENKVYFKLKLQQHDLSSYIEILDTKVIIHQDSVGYDRGKPLLKSAEYFEQKKLPVPEGMITRKVDALPATIDTTPLSIDVVYGNIGSYLTAKDAIALKVTSRPPADEALNGDVLMERPLDGSGGGGMTISEMADEAEKNNDSAPARSNQEDAGFDAAISNSLQDMTFDNTDAAEEPGNDEEIEMTGETYTE
ncbi:MAG: hypothetical protein P8P83_01350 [Rickettsiaceae bacterium]|nr:hypothetical protein [Rickettsiaceae bacterium]